MKIWLSTPKITKTRKLQHCFPIIVNTLRIMVIKTGKKPKTVCFSLIYIRDLNLAPIRFVQFVARFSPRCPLYSFIIFMYLTKCNEGEKVQSKCIKAMEKGELKAKDEFNSFFKESFLMICCKYYFWVVHKIRDASLRRRGVIDDVR